MTESDGDDTDVNPSEDDYGANDAEQVSPSPAAMEAVRRAVGSYTSSTAFTGTNFSAALDESHRRILSIAQPLTKFEGALGANFARIAQITNTAAFPRLPDFGAANSPLRASFAATSALDSDWFKRYTGAGGIDSDIFKTYALAQPNLSGIASALVQNTDFGQGAFARALSGFGQSQFDWLERVSDIASRFRKAWLPANLRDIDDVSIELVEEVVMVDGISLYGVPSPEVAGALLKADSAAKRRDILGRRWKVISEDCRQFAGTVVDGPLQDHAALVIPALDALDAGNYAAAQALGATVIDSILRSRVEKKKRTKYLPDKGGNRIVNYDKLGVRQFIAFAPIWQAYQRFDPDDGDSVPTRFSRHATAHTASRRQFNRRNAVQGILLACGLLSFYEEYGETAVAATP